MNVARYAQLRRPAIKALAVIKKIDAVEATDLRFQDFSPDLENVEALLTS